ncbi:NAD synthetase / Glutamine amidotransferase chain of NAD synthetase [hydrothermal vent metagenome]|uniref:NAD(+) synthase (glutamine-hydrolyzing) n=1 Tax=hydrothermal vent metagenome TaxID=652676 RepID=A0A3B1D067_9ZZZZ
MKTKADSKRKQPPAAQVTLRVAIAQINTTVGDFKNNADKVKTRIKQARQLDADVILFPELTLSGYPPEDLLYKQGFIKENMATLKRIVAHTKGITAIVGTLEQSGNKLYNSAALIANGKLLGYCRKTILPNYGVFDEKRYFREGETPVRFTQNGVTFGITVCEDIWFADGPGKKLCLDGNVDVLLNISSSPFCTGKGEAREKMIRSRARKYKSFIVYANLVGGQDELVFDGQSLVVDPRGNPVANGNSFVEEMIVRDLTVQPKPPVKKSALSKLAGMKTYRVAPSVKVSPQKKQLPKRAFKKLDTIAEIYSALVLGTRDYIRKNGFQKVAIGLSGGVDSALTVAVAADALGSENVTAVLMPSPYTADESGDDSLALAKNLNIQTFTLPIEDAMQAYESVLSDVFKETAADITEENIQARIRGNLLMALSNKFGWMILTTGNKSEISVGYCTLYGDMAGGFAVLKDVPKTWVYDLGHFVNRRDNKIVIPENILTREPTAELRPDQKDTDSLPPYPILDKVLAAYIEEDQSLEDLLKMKLGLPAKEIRRIVRMVDTNEYKRRQGPPGVKITPKAFGRDRRLPITNRFKG